MQISITFTLYKYSRILNVTHTSKMSLKHSPNFSEAELEILIDGVERNRSDLFSKLSNTTDYRGTACRFRPKSEVWSESACGSSVVSSARVSVAPPIPSIGVFPNIPTTLSCSAVSCSGGPPPPVFLASRRLRDAVFFILLE
jgi:hypothetical protein